MVRQLVQEHGITVLATARRPDRLQQLASELPPGRVLVMAGDLVDAGFRNELWQRATALPGGLDLLINNAGAGHYSEFADQDPDAIRQIVELNLMALFDLSQKAVRYMRERGDGQILQISSVLGFFGIPYSAVYVASKHAVNGLVKSLRYELRGTGVRVWAACPGRTESEFSGTALGEGGEPGRLPRGEPTPRVVRSILRGLNRPRAFLVPTWSAWAGLKLSAWIPPLFDWLILWWATRHVGVAIRRAREKQNPPDDHG
jgi:short-subunit dehydrogenase